MENKYYLVRDYKCMQVNNIGNLTDKIQLDDFAIAGSFYQVKLDFMVYHYKLLDSSLNEFTLEINNWKITNIRNNDIIGPTGLIVDLRDPQNKPINYTIHGTSESAFTEMFSKFKTMSSYDNWWHYHFHEEEARFKELIADLQKTNVKLVTENNSLKNQVKAIKNILNEESKIYS